VRPGSSAGALARAARAALEAQHTAATAAPSDQRTLPPLHPPAGMPVDGHVVAARAGRATEPGAADADAPTARLSRPGNAHPVPQHEPAGQRPARHPGTAKRRLLPVAVALAVLLMSAATWTLAARRGARSDAQAADPAPIPSAVTGAPAAPPAAVGPTLSETVFTGWSSGNELTVAVGIKDGRAAAYLGDGRSVEVWLEGILVGNRLSLHGRTADTGVDADVG
jgi:hypothetical protein